MGQLGGDQPGHSGHRPQKFGKLAEGIPSGPTGRRARWHEVFSQLNLEIFYQPGKTNVSADAMSRHAYPVSQGRQDVCLHGSAESSRQVRDMIDNEHTCCVVEQVYALNTHWLERRSQEAYRMHTRVRDKVLADLGVQQMDVAVDLFASCHNHSCPV